MGTLQRLFWHSTFNPAIVFVAIVLAYLAFRANSTERTIFIVFSIALLATETWRGVVRRRKDTASGEPAAGAEVEQP